MTNTKAKITSALIIAFLASTIFFAQTCFAQSNQDTAEIVVESPLGGSTIATDKVTFGFSIRIPAQYAHITIIDGYISIDDQLYRHTRIDIGNINNDKNLHCEWAIDGFSSLTQGAHKIEIKATLSYPSTIFWFMQSYSGIETTPVSVIYYINNRFPPEVSILSSDKYTENQAALNLTTNDASAIFSYSLDNNANVTMPYQHANQYNLTLTGLANGKHNITVYGVDMFGNVGNAEKSFIVDAKNSQSQPASFSALAIFAGGIIAAVTLASLVGLIFYRKTKKSNSQLGKD
jgi:hypothetical protein